MGCDRDLSGEPVLRIRFFPRGDAFVTLPRRASCNALAPWRIVPDLVYRRYRAVREGERNAQRVYARLLRQEWLLMEIEKTAQERLTMQLDLGERLRAAYAERARLEGALDGAAVPHDRQGRGTLTWRCRHVGALESSLPACRSLP